MSIFSKKKTFAPKTILNPSSSEKIDGFQRKYEVYYFLDF